MLLHLPRIRTSKVLITTSDSSLRLRMTLKPQRQILAHSPGPAWTPRHRLFLPVHLLLRIRLETYFSTFTIEQNITCSPPLPWFALPPASVVLPPIPSSEIVWPYLTFSAVFSSLSAFCCFCWEVTASG